MKKFDLCALVFATSCAADHADRFLADAERYRKDEKRAERTAERRCRRCYYLVHRVCGQSFQEWSCTSCQQSFTHHNTCVPRLCYECATKYTACVECCADLDLTERRGVLERKKKLPPCTRTNGRPRYKGQKEVSE